MSHFIHELTNLPPLKKQAFVGESAFAHKGGIHVSAVMKNSDTYEHVEPQSVGNRRRVLISDLSGRANIAYKAQELGVDIDPKDERILEILNELKVLENQGYEFEGADASFELLVRKTLGTYKKRFYLKNTRTLVEKREGDEEPLSEATAEVQVNGVTEYTVARGTGPVSAIDRALRKSLEKFFPGLKDPAAARLQSKGRVEVGRHRFRGEGACRIGRRGENVEHCGGFRQHSGSKLESPCRQHRLQDPKRRA